MDPSGNAMTLEGDFIDPEILSEASSDVSSESHFSYIPNSPNDGATEKTVKVPKP